MIMMNHKSLITSKIRNKLKQIHTNEDNMATYLEVFISTQTQMQKNTIGNSLCYTTLGEMKVSSKMSMRHLLTDTKL